MRRWLMVALALVGFVVSGCGGTSRLSKADYLKRESALDARVSGAFAAVGPARSPQQVAAGLHAAANTVRQAATQQAKIKPPRDAQAVQTDITKAGRDLPEKPKRLRVSHRAAVRRR